MNFIPFCSRWSANVLEQVPRTFLPTLRSIRILVYSRLFFTPPLKRLFTGDYNDRNVFVVTEEGLSKQREVKRREGTFMTSYGNVNAVANLSNECLYPWLKWIRVFSNFGAIKMSSPWSWILEDLAKFKGRHEKKIRRVFTFSIKRHIRKFQVAVM